MVAAKRKNRIEREREREREREKRVYTRHGSWAVQGTALCLSR